MSTKECRTPFAERPLEVRQKLYRSLATQYEDRVPIIVERHPSSDLPMIERRKFLAPTTMSLTAFTNVVRQRLPGISAQQSLFLCMDGRLISPSTLVLSEIYAKHRNQDDGFLYLTYRGEDAMG